MPHYKLTYFNIRGLAEAIRCCLHYGGIEFEDKRVLKDEWAELKPKTPNGSMPLFEVDGKMLTQSGAILRYVARLTGLTGKDSWEEAKADETFHYFIDSLTRDAGPFVWEKAGIFKAADVDAAYKAFVPAATKTLAYYSKMLDEAGNGYVLKSGLTYADFVVYGHALTLQKVDPELAGKFPTVYEFVERIEKIPQLQSYFKTRPDSVN